MKIWTITESKCLQQQEVERTVGENEVKVKVTDVTVSRSDIALYMGHDKARLPVVPGRMAVGLVSEAGEQCPFMKGERVLLTPYRDGKIRGCDIDGYLGDYAVVPGDCVLSLPEGVAASEAIFAEHIALALRAIDKIKVEQGEYVVIMGTKTFGLLAAQLVNFYHAIPIIIGNDAEDLELAADLGITYTINSDKQNVLQRVRDITNGLLCECAICTENGARIQQAFNLAKKMGRICLVGEDEFCREMNVDLKLVLSKRLSIVSVTNGGKNIPAAINMLATDAVSTDALPVVRVDFDTIDATYAEYAKDRPNDLVLCTVD